MTREEARKMIEREDTLRPIKEAYASGKTIQIYFGGSKWEDLDFPNFIELPEKYRVKPEPPRPRTWWINFYPGSGSPGVHSSKQDADLYACSTRVECVHVREVQPEEKP